MNIQQHVRLLMQSYCALLGRPIIDGVDVPSVQQVCNADFALVSHGTEPDPLFNFGNDLALTLFERSFEDFVQLPSRKSSGQTRDEDRIRLLYEVTRNGFIENYSGVRVSASGRKFEISNAVVWNVVDEHEVYRGQAAKISTWRYLD
ncbi:MEKHLA domain-containing protein [Gammaproteobacteria bacterium]|nr:MEKHLA domain-containing protein [Gammaproteobacteria bacterium]MDC1423520.1 MEKHLA domain-containing protein [Gammaproteobacteria bacterium]